LLHIEVDKNVELRRRVLVIDKKNRKIVRVMNTERESRLKQLEWDLIERGWTREAIDLILGSPLVNKCIESFKPEGEDRNSYWTFSEMVA